MRENDQLEGDADQREREIDAHSEDEDSNERDEDDDKEDIKGSTVVDDSETNDDDDNDDVNSVMAEAEDGDASESEGDDASTGTPATSGGVNQKKKKSFPVLASKSGRKGRTPSVAGLTIPFRTVKKAMKLDPDTPIVQNEAAIMTTIAAELFLKRLAKESFHSAKLRGRNTIRYEDIAEARTKNAAMTFLETLFP